MTLCDTKYKKLNNILSNLSTEGCVLAFSGGADSTLLLHMLAMLYKNKKTDFYAVYIKTEQCSSGNIDFCKALAKKYNVKFIVIEIDVLSDEDILNNTRSRCYVCKKHIYNRLVEYAKSVGAKNILDGTNFDDTKSYRPGLKAIEELGIITPLAEAMITKKDVREISEMLCVSTYDKPSSPCMLTRFPYGARINVKILNKVDVAEQYLKKYGFYNLRLRVHDDIVRIEIDEKDFEILINNKNEISQYLKDIGFKYITLDIDGFRSGSMDE